MMSYQSSRVVNITGRRSGTSQVEKEWKGWWKHVWDLVLAHPYL